jgi:uncharacterized iron-regulated membrane protein
MRKLILNLHLIVALIAAVFIVILGLTGSIIAFENELDRVFHPRLSYVKPQGKPLPLSELGAAAAKLVPNQRPAGYGLSGAPDISWQVFFPGRAVYVNQYTGEVLGVRAGPSLVANIHQLHLRLLIRNKADYGKLIMGWAGVAIVFLALSGLYLWWPLKRMTITQGPGVQGGSRRFWFDLHNTVGIFSLIFLVAISLTGVLIGFDEATRPLAYKITGTEPFVVYGPPPKAVGAPSPGAPPITPDKAVEIAGNTLPGALPVSVNIPGPKEVYFIGLRYPDEQVSRSRVYLDPYSGKVLAAESSRSAPAGTRLITVNRAIHTGDILGLSGKTINSLASLILIVQAVSGITMWWKRIRKSRRT